MGQVGREEEHCLKGVTAFTVPRRARVTKLDADRVKGEPHMSEVSQDSSVPSRVYDLQVRWAETLLSA